MTKKHNTKHTERGRSSYAGGASITMPRLEDLRRTQAARERSTGSPWPEPWPGDEERVRLVRAGRSIPDRLAIR